MKVYEGSHAMFDLYADNIGKKTVDDYFVEQIDLYMDEEE